MRLRMKHCVAVLAVLTMTMPAWARTYKETINPEKDTMIGETKLKAGSYELSADDAKKELKIVENGKILATVQGQWVKLPQKTQYSTVVSDGDKITQVQFSGSDTVLRGGSLCQKLALKRGQKLRGHSVSRPGTLLLAGTPDDAGPTKGPSRSHQELWHER
jgi:hypothetical protein